MSVEGRGPRSPIDPGAVLAEAWATFSAFWPTCLFCYWGAIAAFWLLFNLLVIVLASLNVAIGDPGFTPFLEFARFLGLFLIPAWLWLGQVAAFLKIARRQPVVLGDLFRGGPYLLTALLAILAFLAIAAVPCLAIYLTAEALVAAGGGDSLVLTVRRLLPAQAPETVAEFESTLIVGLGLFTVVVGLWYAAFFAVRVRLRTFPFLILDRDAGVLESIRASGRLSRGRAGALLVVHLAQVTINCAGLLVCCVGLLVSLPLTSLISAVTYNALAGDPPPIEAADEEFPDEGA